MKRATGVVLTAAAMVLAFAPAAFADNGTPVSTVPLSTTTTTTTTTMPGAAPDTSKCGVVLGGGVRWVRTTPTCVVSSPVGLSVSVALSGHYRWGALATSSSAIVAVTSTHPAAGGLTGAFRGRAVGTATISAPGAPICKPGQACPQFVLLWRLTVRVVAATPVAASVTVTQADAGTSVTLVKGQRLVVDLAAKAGFAWTVPTAGNVTILQRVSGSPGHAVFDTVGVGSTTVSVVQNPDCYPACLPPSRLLQFRILVQ